MEFPQDRIRVLQVYYPPRNPRRHGPMVKLGELAYQEHNFDSATQMAREAMGEAWENIRSLYGDEPHAPKTAIQLVDLVGPWGNRGRWLMSRTSDDVFFNEDP